MPAAPDLLLETDLARRLKAAGPGAIAGVDEAGRGPWAGPVMTAAVLLDPRDIPAGLDDSKKLSKSRREALFAEICVKAHVGIAWASPARIDAMNIRAATLWAMRRAVLALPLAPAGALVDGRDVPDGLPCPGESVVKGDARSLAIAAASIVAKVARDRMLLALDAQLPGYGFAAHKGYGTAAHAAALAKLGVTPHHRRSFRPIRELL